MNTKARKDNSLYGFGATAPQATISMSHNKAWVLSGLVMALSTAVFVLLSMVLPISPAQASPMIAQAAQTSQELGLTAVTMFTVSTLLSGALIMLAPTLVKRRTNRRYF